MSNLVARRMGGMDESVTLALNARAKQMERDGKTIYNLTAGELASDTPPYVQDEVRSKLSLNKYTPVAGMPELREQIAAEAGRFYGLDWIKPANVVVTAGAKPALYASLMTIINPGDEVIVPIPAWVSYINLIELAGGVAVKVPLTDNFDLDPVVIKASISPKTKAIIVNSPHNPTGAVFSGAALSQLAEILNDTPVLVISDDIYAKLVYDEDFKPAPSCGFEKIIIVNGFSKSQALTGWRIGYAIASTELAAPMTSILSHTSGNAAVPSQHAALAALRLHDKPPESTIALLNKHRQIVHDELASAPKLSHQMPGGAFYVFLDLRKITDDSAGWCEALLQATGVALVPGEAFSAPGFARLSFVTDEKVLRKALLLIKKFAGKELES